MGEFVSWLIVEGEAKCEPSLFDFRVWVIGDVVSGVE